MKIDKSIEIPRFTEIDVQIDTDEIMDELTLSQLMENVRANYEDEEILTHMDVPEKKLTYTDVSVALTDGTLSNHMLVLGFIDDEDIIQYYREKIKGGIDEVNELTIHESIASGRLDSQDVIGAIPREDLLAWVDGLEKEPLKVDDINDSLENGNWDELTLFKFMKIIMRKIL